MIYGENHWNSKEQHGSDYSLLPWQSLLFIYVGSLNSKRFILNLPSVVLNEGHPQNKLSLFFLFWFSATQSREKKYSSGKKTHWTSPPSILTIKHLTTTQPKPAEIDRSHSHMMETTLPQDARCTPKQASTIGCYYVVVCLKSHSIVKHSVDCQTYWQTG